MRETGWTRGALFIEVVWRQSRRVFFNRQRCANCRQRQHFFSAGMRLERVFLSDGIERCLGQLLNLLLDLINRLGRIDDMNMLGIAPGFGKKTFS